MKRIANLILIVTFVFSLVAFSSIASNNDNPLSDVRARQAVAYAIDMDTICATLFEGRALPANSLTPDGVWKISGLNNYAYNPEKAKELLKEAGWDSNYVLDGVYYYGDQLTVDLMIVIQKYLADVGIKATFRRLEGDVGKQLWTPPSDQINGPSYVKWDLAYAAISALTLNEYYSRVSGINSHTPTDSKWNGLVAATVSTTDIDKQKAAYYELQKYENEKLYNIPLYYQPDFMCISKRVNRKGNPLGAVRWAYDWRIIDWDVTPDKNGKNVLYSNTGPVEFFPETSINPGGLVKNVLFDRLIIDDENLVPKKGQLASEYTISEDGKTITFVLRKDVTWHDGEPFTAEDVKFTVEYLSKVPVLNALARQTFSLLEGYDDYINGDSNGISGIVIDGNKVVFKFIKLDPNALVIFSQWSPLPKHLLQRSDILRSQQNKYWQAPVGTGPFKIDEVNMNDYATFTRYEGYWDKTGTGNIEKIQLYPSAESDPNFVVNTEAGKVDYAGIYSLEVCKAVEKMENMKVIPKIVNYTRFFYVNKFPKP
ncbi:hypothetical protein ES705_16989 [subsurface metagenome]